MNASSFLTLMLLVSLLMTGCAQTSAGPPKTRQETAAEALSGHVPDNLRDSRPEMPGMGPLGMPMR